MAKPEKYTNAKIDKIAKQARSILRDAEIKQSKGWVGTGGHTPDTVLDRLVKKLDELQKFSESKAGSSSRLKDQIKRARKELESLYVEVNDIVKGTGFIEKATKGYDAGNRVPFEDFRNYGQGASSIDLSRLSPPEGGPSVNPLLEESRIPPMHVPAEPPRMPSPSPSRAAPTAGPRATQSLGGILTEAGDVVPEITTPYGAADELAQGTGYPIRHGGPLAIAENARPLGTGAVNLGTGTGLVAPLGGPSKFAKSLEGRVQLTSEQSKKEAEKKEKARLEKRDKKSKKGWQKLYESLTSDKALKTAGKIGKGGLLGLPLMALDYFAPDNAIASARESGYDSLSGMGMDVPSAIAGIENDYLRGAAHVADGLLVDPLATLLGGFDKVGDTVSDDLEMLLEDDEEREKLVRKMRKEGAGLMGRYAE